MAVLVRMGQEVLRESQRGPTPWGPDAATKRQGGRERDRHTETDKEERKRDKETDKQTRKETETNLQERKAEEREKRSQK